MSKLVAVIAGVGPGTGSAIARRFAKAYPVVLLARSRGSLDSLVETINHEGGSAIGIPTDVTDSASMDSTMSQVKTKFGSDVQVTAAIYNVAGAFSRKGFLEQSREEFLTSLDPTINGAYNFARAVLPLMGTKDKPEGQHPPTLIFTGATASLKGGSGLAAFAMSKFGIRAMSQSLAREFGPQGIHVSHAIIDGIIDTEKTKGFMQDKPDGKIDPNWIAESYWFLHTQPRTTFTHEIDLRPYSETW